MRYSDRREFQKRVNSVGKWIYSITHAEDAVAMDGYLYINKQD